MDRKPTYNELELRVKALEKELQDVKKGEEIPHEAESIRQLLKFAPFGVYLIDLSGKIIACNENGAGRLGKTIETAIGTVLRDYFPAKVSENRRLKGMEAIQSRQAVTFEDQIEGRCYRNSIFPFFDEEGKPVQLAIYGADVTEYKNALEALKHSEEKHRQLAELLPQVVFEADEMGNLTFTNHAAFDLFGYTRADFEKGLNAFQMLIPEDRERAGANFQMARRGEHLGGTEYTALTKDGGRYPVMLYSSPIISEGKLLGLRGIMIDLTEIRRAEQALRESEENLRIRNRIASVFLTKTDEEMYQEVLELVLDKLKSRFGVFGYIDDKGSLVCPSMTRIIWDQCQIPDKDIVFPEDTWGDAIWANGLRTRKSAYANRLFKVPEGHIPIERCLTVPLVFQDRSIGLLTVANKDTDYDESDRETLEAIAEYVAPVLQGILVRNAIKKSLQESEERYRILVEESPLGVSLIGKDGRYRYLNPKFIEIFGYGLQEIPTGKEWFRKAYPDEKYRKEVLATWIDDHKRYGIGGARPRTYLITCKDGSRKVILFRPVTMESGDQLVLYEDVTETQRLEERLRRAQKMEALGLLAGGVAHDLNNILSGIVSYPELILMDLPEGSPLRKPMKTIHESGMRAAGVVSDLLTIARGVATGKETLNLNSIVNEYLGSPEYQKLEEMQPVVNFRTDLDCHLLNMRGSPIHLKKTLMNLVTNASEAIEGAGTVTISTFNRYLDEPLKGYDDVRTGEYVVLSVSDNGRGISSKDLERIFEPFYTKKVMGRSGTGLGLAVVWNTVQDHNGYINVKTSEKGTVFELYFPVTRKEIAAAKEPVDLKDYMGHGEKILVVDDEESQREIAIGILTKLGYHAAAVSSGEEAIEYVRTSPVDLIVLDMVMPKGMNGRETYQEILKIRPGQKAIIASGYAQTEEVTAAQDLGAGKYIKKPYALEKIGVAVKEELEK